MSETFISDNLIETIQQAREVQTITVDGLDYLSHPPILPPPEPVAETLKINTQQTGSLFGGCLMNYWIFLGNDDDGKVLMTADLPKRFTCWTADKRAQIGDECFFYITAPISRIVARGKICSQPELNENPFDRWEGHYMAEINELRLIDDTQLHIKDIRSLFFDWAFWRYPRRNSRVPDKFVEPFLELVDNQTL